MTKRNIFITGVPHSGKSTLLHKILEGVGEKQGFVTLEILENEQRVGFKLVTASGEESILASTQIETPFKVSKYSVIIENLDNIVSKVRTVTETDLLYIDEIGQMELFSEEFTSLVKQYLNAPNIFIATISKVYSNEFTLSILARDDLEVIEITPENRSEVYTQLKQLLASA